MGKRRKEESEERSEWITEIVEKEQISKVGLEIKRIGRNV